ncbi:MAG TPA: hypothetical protein VGD84_24350 [Pseudonocardiaceae bacterium]
MPPPRRRPIPAPSPVRRPRVAGLRHPEAPHPATDEAEITQVIPVISDEPPTARKPRPTTKPKAAWTEAGSASDRRPAKPERRSDAVPDLPAPDMPVVDVVDAEPRSRSLVLPVVLAVVAVLIGGLASWFGVQWAHAQGQVQNTALVDSAGTAEVSGQVVSAVGTVFSYNYTNMGKTESAVQRLLTGNALCQYNLLFKVVKQQAPGQKLVLTTTVQAKGVEMLQGSTARVLLLVQQTDTRASTNQTSTSQSMIAVNAVKQGGTWQISGIDTFNGDNTTPGCKS